MNGVDSNLTGRMRFSAAAAGVVGVAIALTVIVGWIFNITVLENMHAGLATMKINTAVALLCCGASLWLQVVTRRRSRWESAAQLLAAAAVIIGLLTLIQYTLGVNLGIDELLRRDTSSVAPLHPGRMSVATAMCLVCTGSAIGLLDRSAGLSQAMALAAVAISMLDMLGYAYGIKSLYRVAAFSTMALHTAGIVCVVSIGVLLARPHRFAHRMLSSPSAGGVMMRRLLPGTLLIPLILGWLQLRGQYAGWYDNEFGLSLFALTTILILTTLVWWNARLLDRSDMRRRHLEADRADLLVRERGARQRAENALFARDQLMSMVSHELRTPLTPVLLIATALENRPQLPDDVRDDLRVVREQVQIESRLIDDLLDLVSLGQGKLAIKRQSVDLNELCRKVIENFSAAFAGKGVQLHRELSARRALVNGDSGRLQQVLRNLLDNALKFTPAGGQVWVGASDGEGGQLVLEVRDSGVGIEPEALGRIFGAFEQGDLSTKRRFGGLGIGLTICRMLVGLHGGTIRAASGGADKGATFVVELPASKPEPVETVAPAAGVVSPQRRLRILLVEDNSDTLHVLGRVLRGQGHDVTAVGAAQAAIDAAEKQSFDLLVSDIGLPDMSGWELLGRLRNVRPIRAIAISGFVSDADRRRSAEAGFFCHLGKPLEMDRLLDALNATEKTEDGGSRMEDRG